MEYIAGECKRHCGDVFVPYPFGVGHESCYWPGLNLTCDDGEGREDGLPRLFFSDDKTTRVVDISTRNNTVRVLSTGATRVLRPTDRTWARGGDDQLVIDSILAGRGELPYSLSTRNEFVLIGCNLTTTLSGDGDPSIISACASFCSSSTSSNKTATKKKGDSSDQCYGMGCCKARISVSNDSMPNRVDYRWFDKDYEGANEDDWSQPAYMFISEEGWFNLGRVSDELPRESWENELQIPIILQWEVLHGFPPPPANTKSLRPNCPREVANSLCKSKHSYCTQETRGYSCHCSQGYDANPDANPYNSGGCKGMHPAS